MPRRRDLSVYVVDLSEAAPNNGRADTGLLEIERPASLTLRYLDRNGKPQELDADGLLATAIQHELNHLDGKLIIDFLSPLKRDMVVRKFKKQARATL